MGGGRLGRVGGGACLGSVADVEEQADQGFRILDFFEVLLELGHRPANELELLVLLRSRFALVEILREEEMHPLAAEARRREEGPHLMPVAAPQPRLLLELPARPLDRARRLPPPRDARRSPARARPNARG